MFKSYNVKLSEKVTKEIEEKQWNTLWQLRRRFVKSVLPAQISNLLIIIYLHDQIKTLRILASFFVFFVLWNNRVMFQWRLDIQSTHIRFSCNVQDVKWTTYVYIFNLMQASSAYPIGSCCDKSYQFVSAQWCIR